MHVIFFFLHVMHVRSTHVDSLCLCVCGYVCQTGTEAIEVETLTQNNEAVPHLPVSGGNEH